MSRLLSTSRFTVSSKDTILPIIFERPEELSILKILWIFGRLKSQSIKRTLFSILEKEIARLAETVLFPSPFEWLVTAKIFLSTAESENIMFVRADLYDSTIANFDLSVKVPPAFSIIVFFLFFSFPNSFIFIAITYLEFQNQEFPQIQASRRFPEYHHPLWLLY